MYKYTLIFSTEKKSEKVISSRQKISTNDLENALFVLKKEKQITEQEALHCVGIRPTGTVSVLL